jgi:transcriptional regulator with XRE-family HTH domain
MASTPTSFTTRKRMGRILRRRRRDLNLTIEYVALVCETSQSNLSYIENGHGSPSLEIFIRLCRTLGLSANVLLNLPEPLHVPAE